MREDPLSEQARSQHRNVMLVGSVAILVAQLNLVPTRISALVVQLQSNDRHAIRIALVLAVLYFAAAFFAAAIPDYVTWRARHRESRDWRDVTNLNVAKYTRQVEQFSKTGSDVQRNEALTTLLDCQTRVALYRVMVPMGTRRSIIDFAVPSAVAVAAIVLLALDLT